MATLTKHLLSVSLSGIGVHVTSADPIQPISFHKAGTSMSNLDEVYVYGTNISSSTVTLTSIWGLSAWDALPKVQNSLATVLTIPANTRMVIANGRLIQNGLSACAYVSTAGTVVLDGYINRITA
tara:strand:+ start:546 stop:920 length:375 start_codon:yes stop_codon:yes gene_type:complete